MCKGTTASKSWISSQRRRAWFSNELLRAYQAELVLNYVVKLLNKLFGINVFSYRCDSGNVCAGCDRHVSKGSPRVKIWIWIQCESYTLMFFVEHVQCFMLSNIHTVIAQKCSSFTWAELKYKKSSFDLFKIPNTFVENIFHNIVCEYSIFISRNKIIQNWHVKNVRSNNRLNHQALNRPFWAVHGLWYDKLLRRPSCLSN